MGKILIVLAVLGGGALVMKNCAAGSTKDVPFVGKWTIVTKDEMQGNQIDNTSRVISGEGKYRIEREIFDHYWGSTTEEILVFDGKTLYTKTSVVYPESSSYENKAPTYTAVPLSYARARQHIFWRTVTDPKAKAGPGGLVAGRETTLFQSRGNRPDGAATVQIWVDAETGVVLKQTQSIYSKHVEMEISRVSIECEEISFGPLDESVFEKPA